MAQNIQQQIDLMNQQVGQLYQQGRYEEAIGIATQTAVLASQHLGQDHPDFATSLNNLAMLYQAKGSYAAAEPLHQKALEIRRTVLGEHHPDYGQSLHNLAFLNKLTGNYVAAEPLYQQALEICRTTLGEDHPRYAMSLDNLGLLYQSIGNYAAAEPLHQKAREILHTALGEYHLDHATSVNNLALLYKTIGNYAAAEPLYQKAREILRSALGEDHPSYASSLSNLAILYQLMGNYAAAEPLYQQALEILDKALGEGHPYYAASLSSLASLYQSLGNYATAEQLHQKALESCRTALGDAHPSYATSLNNLAMLYQSMGNYTAAEPLHQKALEIRRTVLGDDHPDYGQSLNNLALLYRLAGDYAAAVPLHQKVQEVYRRAFGEYHPDFATILNNLALIYVLVSRQAEAMILVQQAATIDDRTIGQVFSIGSESQRMAYLTTIQSNFEMLLSLVSQYFSSSPAALQSALDLVLRRKAIGAEALAAQRDAVLGGKYPALEPKLKVLTTLRMQIAQKTLAGPGAEDLAAHQKLLAEWNAQKERLEAELVRLIPEMNLEQKLRAADRQAVALALPANAVLVEFVRFNALDFKAVPARGESQWQPPHYLAFVLPAQEPDNVQMIDLGPAEPIDQMIATFRATITGEGESRGYQDQEATLSEGFSDLSDGAALRTTIFDPLLMAIGDRTRLLLAPDGDLTRLPFEVLPSANGGRLIDEYRISYLGAGRDVLRFGAASMVQATAPLVVADPDFDLAEGSAASLQQLARVAQTASSSRLSRDANRNAMHFGRLPGTQVEGQRIAQMLGVEPRLAAAALESQLKACRSPRILHLATHGFFLADQKLDPNNEQGNVMALGEQSTERMGRFTGRGLENPLLRSGLALAGVNTWLQQGTVPTEAEDGILTAEDVSGLDLLATELVVLSACETGLGEVHTGEGVFGLRRAFVLAGARTLVMSLWKVSDLSTAILMERFYHNLLERKMGGDESLREAQFYTRDVNVGEIRDGWLRAEVIERLAAGDEKAKNYFQRLARKPDEHRPFSAVEYWGAFICQGDPAAMV